MLNSSKNIREELAVGSIIPVGNPHGISVSLPKLTDVVAYEEGNLSLIQKLKGGYPRFVFHAYCRQLCERHQIHIRRGLQKNVNEALNFLIFPSVRVAYQCIEFIGDGCVIGIENDSVAVAVFPSRHTARAKEYWQHTGQIISSRWAEDLLRGNLTPPSPQILHDLRARIGALQGTVANDVYVMPTGMAAIFEMHQAVTSNTAAATIQLGFPYLDTYKIQEKFGEGVVYVPYDAPADLGRVKHILTTTDISAVFCEIPGNPLLKTIDLEALTDILRPHQIPLIVDDVLGLGNVDVRPYADAMVTSLTKYFVGTGDAMGGSVALNRNSPHYERFKQYLENSENLLYVRDAETLLHGARSFEARMDRVNDSAVQLAQFLRAHTAIDQVNYTDRDPAYRNILKDGGGYGGLLSFTLKKPELLAEFYDRLDVLKGPSLGMNETLVCLYTFLVHYREFDEAAKSGVAPHLIRVSVGLEPPEQIIAAFDKALNYAVSMPNPRRVFFPGHPKGKDNGIVIEPAPG